MSFWKGQKVLLLSSSYPFHRKDFHALFIHEMAVAIGDAGGDAFVLTPSTPEAEVKNEVWDGVNVHRFRYFGAKSPFWSLTGRDGIWENFKANPLRACILPFFLFSFLRAFRKIMGKGEFKLIVTHWLIPSGFIGALVGWGKKQIHYAHSTDVHLLRRLPILGRFIVRFIEKRGPIFVPSQYLSSVLTGLARNPPVISTLGVKVPEAQPMSKNENIERLRFGYFGRFTNSKGLHRALDVVSKIPNATLALAGEGREEVSLRERIVKENLRAEMYGPVVGKDKSLFLDEIDFFLFLADEVTSDSFQDNLPVSILEALAHGVPVVSTRVGEIPRLVKKSGAGMVVSSNTLAIARKLQELKSEDLWEMKKKAKQFREDLSWEKCLQRVESELLP